MPKYNPDTDWSTNEETTKSDETATDNPRHITVSTHVVRVHDERDDALNECGVEYSVFITENFDVQGVHAYRLYETPAHNTREQEFSPITVLDDEQRNVTADDLPEPVCDAVVAELTGVSNDGATPDGVTVDEHVVRVDDFREDAADPRGMTYHVSLSVGSVAGVSGGHYFQDSNGNRITSQWDPMDLTWNDVPTAVREVIADRLDFQLLDSN